MRLLLRKRYNLIAYKVIYIENGKRYDNDLVIQRRPVGHERFYAAFPKAKKGPYFVEYNCDIEYEKV